MAKNRLFLHFSFKFSLTKLCNLFNFTIQSIFAWFVLIIVIFTFQSALCFVLKFCSPRTRYSLLDDGQVFVFLFVVFFCLELIFSLAYHGAYANLEYKCLKRWHRCVLLWQHRSCMWRSSRPTGECGSIRKVIIIKKVTEFCFCSVFDIKPVHHAKR